MSEHTTYRLIATLRNPFKRHLRLITLVLMVLLLSSIGMPTATTHASTSSGAFDSYFGGCEGPGVWAHIYDDYDRSVRYSDGWNASYPAQGSPYGQTEHYSRARGVVATFHTPSDADISYLVVGFTKKPNFGLAAIYIDDVYAETINMYSPTNLYRCEQIYVIHLTGSHTMKVKVLNQYGGGAGTYVVVDYFAYTFP